MNFVKEKNKLPGEEVYMARCLHNGFVLQYHNKLDFENPYLSILDMDSCTVKMLDIELGFNS
jgi:hypothetical protein